MSAHTSLPWRVGGGALNVGRLTVLGPDANASGWPCVCVLSGDPSGQLPQANAEFIVRACNSHTDLLKALKRIDDEAGCEAAEYVPALPRIWQIARTAIAKAEGR